MEDWRVGEVEATGSGWEESKWLPEWSAVDIDPAGTTLAYSRKNTIYLRSIEDWNRPPLRLGAHQNNIVRIALAPEGAHVAAQDESGELWVWEGDGKAIEPVRRFQAEGSRYILFDPSGRWLAAHGMVEGVLTVRLWYLEAPQGADPVTLKRTDGTYQNDLAIHPDGSVLVTSDYETPAFWPFPVRPPWVLRGHEGRVDAVAFSPDGRWLVSAAKDGVRAWPLRGQNEGAARILLDRSPVSFTELAFDPGGDQVAVGSREGAVLLIPMDGGPARDLPGSWFGTGGGMLLDFSPDGKRLAAIPIWGVERDLVIRVWDLASGDVQVLDTDFGQKKINTSYLGFADDRHLRWVAIDVPGQKSWEALFDVEEGTRVVVSDSPGFQGGRVYSSQNEFVVAVSSSADSRFREELHWKSLESGESRPITTHGYDFWAVLLDPSDRWIVTGDGEGILRAGPVSGEEPHLLFGHMGSISSVDVSPDGQWIASGGADGTVRLWPVPELSEPPLHTLPHDELIAKLHSLTNLRVVEDPESSSGWKIDYAPFPGWREIPEW